MEIQVKRDYLKYKAIVLKEGGTTIDTGLLDESESLSYAKEFISAAQDLTTEADFKQSLKDIGIDCDEYKDKVKYYESLINFLCELIPDSEEIIEEFDKKHKESKDEHS